MKSVSARLPSQSHSNKTRDQKIKEALHTLQQDGGDIPAAFPLGSSRVSSIAPTRPAPQLPSFVAAMSDQIAPFDVTGQEVPHFDALDNAVTEMQALRQSLVKQIGQLRDAAPGAFRDGYEYLANNFDGELYVEMGLSGPHIGLAVHSKEGSELSKKLNGLAEEDTPETREKFLADVTARHIAYTQNALQLPSSSASREFIGQVGDGIALALSAAHKPRVARQVQAVTNGVVSAMGHIQTITRMQNTAAATQSLASSGGLAMVNPWLGLFSAGLSIFSAFGSEGDDDVLGEYFEQVHQAIHQAVVTLATCIDDAKVEIKSAIEESREENKQFALATLEQIGLLRCGQGDIKTEIRRLAKSQMSSFKFLQNLALYSEARATERHAQYMEGFALLRSEKVDADLRRLTPLLKGALSPELLRESIATFYTHAVSTAASTTLTGANLSIEDEGVVAESLSLKSTDKDPPVFAHPVFTHLAMLEKFAAKVLGEESQSDTIVNPVMWMLSADFIVRAIQTAAGQDIAFATQEDKRAAQVQLRQTLNAGKSIAQAVERIASPTLTENLVAQYLSSKNTLRKEISRLITEQHEHLKQEAMQRVRSALAADINAIDAMLAKGVTFADLSRCVREARAIFDQVWEPWPAESHRTARVKFDNTVSEWSFHYKNDGKMEHDWQCNGAGLPRPGNIISVRAEAGHRPRTNRDQLSRDPAFRLGFSSHFPNSSYWPHAIPRVFVPTWKAGALEKTSPIVEEFHNLSGRSADAFVAEETTRWRDYVLELRNKIIQRAENLLTALQTAKRIDEIAAATSLSRVVFPTGSYDTRLLLPDNACVIDPRYCLAELLGKLSIRYCYEVDNQGQLTIQALATELSTNATTAIGRWQWQMDLTDLKEEHCDERLLNFWYGGRAARVDDILGWTEVTNGVSKIVKKRWPAIEPYAGVMESAHAVANKVTSLNETMPVPARAIVQEMNEEISEAIALILRDPSNAAIQKSANLQNAMLHLLMSQYVVAFPDQAKTPFLDNIAHYAWPKDSGILDLARECVANESAAETSTDSAIQHSSAMRERASSYQPFHQSQMRGLTRCLEWLDQADVRSPMDAQALAQHQELTQLRMSLEQMSVMMQIQADRAERNEQALSVMLERLSQTRPHAKPAGQAVAPRIRHGAQLAVRIKSNRLARTSTSQLG